MERRTFLAGAAGATAAVGLAAPALAQERTTWRMVTTWPRGFPGLGVGAQRLADRITAMSGGRLTIEVFAGGEMVPPLQAFDAVIEGSAEMSHGAAYYWQNKSQATNFFTGVPFGMTSRELAAWIRYMGGQELWDEVYDQFGMKGFINGDTGVQAGGWFANELQGLEDIQGINFRTPGLGGQVWSRLGANVVNMPAGELFAALQSGALDAVEFVGPYNDLALGFHQVRSHYYTSSFIEPGAATELAVDRAKLEALPDDLQQIVEIACQAEYDQVASDFYANDPPALRRLVDEHGVTVHSTFPDDILEAGAAAARDIFEELRASNDELTRRVTEHFLESLSQVRTRTEQTDAPFVAARERFFDVS